MASLDYFVATAERNDKIEAVEPRILGSLADGKQVDLYGYKGMVKGKLGYAIRRDGIRFMVFGTGSVAHDAATRFLSLSDLTGGISIARIDVQETLSVVNADRIIVFLSPKKSYGATRISSLNSPGETLYVGSPKSRARLRVYNKTAESGVMDGENELLRVEVQLRDYYADIAWRMWREGKLHEIIAFWVRKMLQEGSANDIMNLCSMFASKTNFFPEDDEESWIDRRKRWFEMTVVPAMAKLFVTDPRYIDVAKRLLTGEGGENGLADSSECNWTHSTERNKDER